MWQTLATPRVFTHQKQIPKETFSIRNPSFLQTSWSWEQVIEKQQAGQLCTLNSREASAVWPWVQQTHHSRTASSHAFFFQEKLLWSILSYKRKICMSLSFSFFYRFLYRQGVYYVFKSPFSATGFIQPGNLKNNRSVFQVIQRNK